MKIIRTRTVIYLLTHLLILSVGIILLKSQNNTACNIGAGVIATAVVGFFLFIYVVYSETFAEKISMLITLGLHQAFTQRGPKIEPGYERRIESAKKRIWVMACRGGKFRRHFGNMFTEWALNETLDVRILLTDPTFPTTEKSVAYLRDMEEPKNSHKPGRSREDIEKFISFYKGEIAKVDTVKNFELRLSKCMPAFTMVLIDNEIIWGPYFVNKESEETPSFLIKQGGELFDDFEHQFLEIWKSSLYSRNAID